MTLYSGDTDLLSHRVRIVLAEKDVTVDVLTTKTQQLPEDLIHLNPYNTLPTLVDRDLVLYESRIIMEYLDERFPHPPLLPVYPIARAKSRLTMYRIEQDWYTLVDTIENGVKKSADAARKELEESLIALVPVFADTPYFFKPRIQLVRLLHCAFIVAFAQIRHYFFNRRGTKPITTYAKKLFKRSSFQSSLTEFEREFPKYDFQ